MLIQKSILVPISYTIDDFKRIAFDWCKRKRLRFISIDAEATANSNILQLIIKACKDKFNKGDYIKINGSDKIYTVQHVGEDRYILYYFKYDIVNFDKFWLEDNASLFEDRL